MPLTLWTDIAEHGRHLHVSALLAAASDSVLWSRRGALLLDARAAALGRLTNGYVAVLQDDRGTYAPRRPTNETDEWAWQAGF